jgi:NADH pyrophosphatase NudC (nudix superfamily)
MKQPLIQEVSEEVGIRVKNVRYFGSQPWPFSYSLMIGFTCEWQEGEIQMTLTDLLFYVNFWAAKCAVKKIKVSARQQYN